MVDIQKSIHDFFNSRDNDFITCYNICSSTNDKVDKDYKCRVYNEFSLQHELGLYLRKNFKEENVIVLFEKNVKSFTGGEKFKNWEKYEIDIVIIDKKTDNKYAIELKFPINGQYPEQMFQFIKDIRFMEQVKEYINFNETYCLTLVNDSSFYSDTSEKNKKIETNNGKIYKYFRNNKNETIGTQEIYDPVQHSKQKGRYKISTKGKYNVEWKQIKNNRKLKYYLIKCKTN